MMLRLTAILGILLLTGCFEDDLPPPVARALTVDAIGYYCNMTITDHPGPKGQIHRAGGQKPLWFSSVRDAVAFTMLADEAKDVVAVYVHDMGGKRNWSTPGDGGWIEARSAWFVLDSRRRGGMGMAEAVPFADKAEATGFMARHGGNMVDWRGIPQDYILTAGEDQHHGPAGPQDGDHKTSGDMKHGAHKMHEG